MDSLFNLLSTLDKTIVSLIIIGITIVNNQILDIFQHRVDTPFTTGGPVNDLISSGDFDLVFAFGARLKSNIQRIPTVGKDLHL